nr:UDP-2,4-diacetamido-2,4,6-trideoxy-beta-L-altropyranose hydrolase [Phaeovibrio sulfidiphilus]
MICADTSPRMGTGHVMRSLALIQSCRAAGIPVHLASRMDVSWVRERLATEGVPFSPLSDAIPRQESPDVLLAHIRQTGLDPAWVVLDGYHFGPDCQSALREAGYRVLVVDDYAHQPVYHCDALLNQNLGAEHLSYHGDIGLRLFGPRHALLRREFREAQRSVTPHCGKTPVRSLLLTFGGGSFADVLPSLAPALAQPGLAGCTLRVIGGSMRERQVREALEDCPARVEVLYQVRDMPALMEQTDLCITAGGSTCWELCALGVPFLTVEIAENQRAAIRELERCDLAWPFSADRLAGFLASPSLTARVSERLLAMGVGAGEAELMRLFSSPALALRDVGPGDCDPLLDLANDPAVRGNSLTTDAIARPEHEAWFARMLASGQPFYILEADGRFAGYVRFSVSGRRATVSIALSASVRGKGIGARALSLALARLFASGAADRVEAVVVASNAASERLFRQAGFTLQREWGEGGRTLLLFTMDAATFGKE